MPTIAAIRVLLVNCPNLALEEAGGERKMLTHRAVNGAAASALVKQHEFRLMLVQLPLPDLSPGDLMYYTRNEAATKCKQTSVVAIANAKDQKLIHEGLKAGMNDYQVAPVSRDRLEAILGKFGEFAARRDCRLMLKAKIDLPLNDKPFFGQTLNVSRRGLLLICDRELPIGTPINVQFSLPGDPQPVKAAGVIVREAPDRAAGKGRVYGVHFTHLDPASRLKVIDYARK